MNNECIKRKHIGYKDTGTCFSVFFMIYCSLLSLIWNKEIYFCLRESEEKSDG